MLPEPEKNVDRETRKSLICQNISRDTFTLLYLRKKI
jgi:hypothetical protein